MTDELAYTPIRRLAGMLRGRSLSPVELAEYCLGRLERLGPRYNALVTLTADRALELARNEESEIAQGRYRGLLQGIPWGAKDLLATSGGIPTTWGAAPFRDQQFEYDATVVARLEESGAPLAAKLAMIELAGGMGYTHPDASLTGPPQNPWDAGRWTGGFVQRVRRGGGGRNGPICDWLGDMGVYPAACGELWSVRAAANLRTGQPPRCDGFVLDAGQAGTALPYGRRLRDRARGYLGSGPKRPDDPR